MVCVNDNNNASWNAGQIVHHSRSALDAFVNTGHLKWKFPFIRWDLPLLPSRGSWGTSGSPRPMAGRDEPRLQGKYREVTWPGRHRLGGSLDQSLAHWARKRWGVPGRISCSRSLSHTRTHSLSRDAHAKAADGSTIKVVSNRSGIG